VGVNRLEGIKLDPQEIRAHCPQRKIKSRRVKLFRVLRVADMIDPVGF